MTLSCADASREAAEPLAGTAAAGTVRWLMIEYTRPWRAKAVLDNELPPAALDAIRAWQAVPGQRAILVKQRGRRGQAVLLADVVTGRVHRFELHDPAGLADLPLAAVAAGTTEAGRVDERPILVCAHSARDACCGLHGAALARALAAVAAERVWMSTHLGGHRFAATLVALPEGAMYGRVAPDEAPALLAALDAGRWHDLDRARGLVALSEPAQAAALHLARLTGNADLRAIRVLDEAMDGDAAIVTAATDDGPIRLRAARVPLGPSAPPSCGDGPAPVKGWVVQPL
jgi:hypothetical protein